MAIKLQKRKQIEKDFINAAPQKVETISTIDSTSPTKETSKNKGVFTNIFIEPDDKEQLKRIKADFKVTHKQLISKAIAEAKDKEDKMNFEVILKKFVKSSVLLPHDDYEIVKELSQKYSLSIPQTMQIIIREYLKSLKI